MDVENWDRAVDIRIQEKGVLRRAVTDVKITPTCSSMIKAASRGFRTAFGR
ncbi:hypothetical protein AB0J28_13670 [Streptosporangium canum]|uniref:hypothetical protein n=1 Tax=Streptosporangium canum TaxID=324952 RepID=UPI0034338DF4